MGLVSMILWFKFLSAQDIKPLDIFPLLEGKINYNEVIYLDSSISAETLYLRAKKWSIDNFGSGKEVAELDDRTTYTLIVKGFSEIRPHNPYAKHPRLWYIFKINAKQGRYRYELYNHRYNGTVVFLDKREDFDFELTDWVSRISDDLPKKRKKMIFDYLYYIDSLNVSNINSLKEAMLKADNTTW